MAGGDVLVISGSLPAGCDASVVSDLVTTGKELGAYVILDSSGDGLKCGIASRPHMVKPNLLELSALVEESVSHSDSRIIEHGRRVLSSGVELVLISRGRDGVIVLQGNSDQVWKAYLQEGKVTRETAGVGSGDTLVSAFAFSTLHASSLEDMLRLAVSVGAANVLARAPGRFSLSDVDSLKPCVTVQSRVR